MRNRLRLRARDLDAPLFWSRRSGRMVDSDIRGAGPFALGSHHRTLDVYGHPQYRLRRVA